MTKVYKTSSAAETIALGEEIGRRLKGGDLRLSHTVCLQFHFSPAHYASVKMRLESHHLDVEQLQEDSFLQPHKFLQNFEIFSIIGTIDYIFFYYIMKKAKSNK